MSTAEHSIDFDSLDYHVEDVNPHPGLGSQDISKVVFSYPEGEVAEEVANSFFEIINPGLELEGSRVYLPEKTEEAEEFVEGYLEDLKDELR